MVFFFFSPDLVILTLQQYRYLVMEFNDENHFVTQMSSLGDAIHLLSPIGLSW